MLTENEMSLSALVELYLDRLQTLNYSNYTIKGRRSTLGIFTRFCATKSIQRPYQLTESILREYLKYLNKLPNRTGETCTALTTQTRFSAVRMFCDYLAKKHLLLADPSNGIELNQKNSRPPVPTLTKIQVERIMFLPDIETPEGIRDRAILETFYSTGLRRNELSFLLLADTHLHSKTVFVRKGKGGHDRVIPIGERACKWIEKYLADGRSFFTRKLDSGYLFLNRHGTQVSANQLTKITSKYIAQARINKQGACHIFRHTAATLMLEGGAEMTQIQEFLGHQSPNTTEIYTHVSSKKLTQEYRRTHPSTYMEAEETAKEKSHGKKKVMQFATRETNRKPVEKPLNENPNDELDKSLKIFHELLNVQKYADRTLRKHLKIASDFMNWCRTKKHFHLSGISASVMERYQKFLTESTDHYGKPVSPQKQYETVLSLRVFFRLLYKAGLILHNPMDGVTLPRVTRRLPADVLTAEEMEQVLASPDTSRPYGLRDKALMELLYATAIRRQELATIQLKDIDLKYKRIKIRGNNERNLPLPERAVVWLTRYLEKSRPEFTRSLVENLFLGSNGKAITANAITSICSTHMRQSGLTKKGAVHIFRNTAAVLMLENGIDLRTLQEYLGHKNASSTQLYAKLNIQKLREVHERTHPGANIKELKD